MFYAVSTAWVIFTAKTSMDVFLDKNRFELFQSWVTESMRRGAYL